MTYKCEDCTGGPCELITNYPATQEGIKAIQCPFDQIGVGSAVWLEKKEDKDEA